jgi:ZIP family zinc transporter
MVAASFWSLLAPGVEMTAGEGFSKVMPAAIGFFLGALFIFGIDKVLPHIHINFKVTEGIKSFWQRTTLLVYAVTLHNISE